MTDRPSGLNSRLLSWPWLWRSVDRFESRGSRAAGYFTPAERSKIRLFVALFCAIIPAIFIGSEIKQLIAPSDDVYGNPEFYNLTKDGIVWDVYYGRPVPCGTQDCHLTADYPSDQFTKKMILPAREFPLVGYKDGDIVYARTNITVPQKILDQGKPIVFHSLYVWAKRYELYVNGVQLDEGSAETINATIPRHLIPASGDLKIAMKIDPAGLPYQGIAHRKDLLIGDKDKLKRTAWRSIEISTTYFLWFLIPKMTFCFIFAALYIFVAQNRELFSFIAYIFLSAISILLESAYGQWLNQFIGDTAVVAPLFLCASDLFLMMFFHDFFRRDGDFFKKIYYAAWGLFAVSSISVIFFLNGKTGVNASLALEVFLRIAATGYGLSCSLFTAFSLHRSAKSPGRKTIAIILFTTLAASIYPLVMHIALMVGDILNLNPTGFPYIQAFDLVLFGVLALISANEFGVTAAQKQQIQGELRVIEERLNLARSVQNLLLPSQKSGVVAQADYQYFFESADTVAGDWFYIWDAGPDEVRLFIGDVTGKGPQAALTVSAVISALAGCKDDKLTVEDTIRVLNRRLFSLFKGKVLTVMNVTVLKSSRQVDCYNFGSVGWVVGQKGSFNLATLKGSQIGLNPEIEINKMTINCEKDDTLFTFTDGIVEGSRGLKKLITGLKENKNLKTGKEFFDFAVETGRKYVHLDDRALLFVKFN